MLEIIALIYLSRKNGELAIKKGLKPGRWKLYTVLAWLGAELIGAMIGLLMFGKTNMVSALLVALFVAFGGYLLVRYTLENKPDDKMEQEVNQIGIDDLRPPGKGDDLIK
ncbi:MAG: hypothetical protein RL172_1918 [Bacteroidota bacterium]|jgi:hypothetical protein